MAKRLLILASIILFLCASCIIYDPYGGVALHHVPGWLRGVWRGQYSYDEVTVTPYNIFGYGPDGIWFDMGRYPHNLLNEKTGSNTAYEVDYDYGRIVYRFEYHSWDRITFTVTSGGTVRSEEYCWVRDIPRY